MALFRYHENIIDAFILEKKSKNGKRFGFVRFSKILDAQRAISRINRFVIMGSKIWVKMAKFKGKRKIWKKVQAQASSNQRKEIQPKGKEREEVERGEISGKNNYETFKCVARLWGELVSMGANLTKINNFEMMEFFISIKHPYQLEEIIMFEAGDVIFSISIKERRLTELINVKTRKEMGAIGEKKESSEVGSIIKSELDLSPEGRLNDWEEKANAPYIEKDGNGKGSQRIWVDAINEEDNFLSHNRSIPVEGYATDVLMDRANEDISSMCLSMEMDQNEGLEIQIEEGIKVGLSEQVRQISDKDFEVEEELFQIIQNRRKKKALNKRIRFIREIQERVLTTKEKPRRDRRTRKETGNEGKLSFRVRGDEDVVINELMMVEGQSNMRIVSWNVRGLGPEAKIESVKRIIQMKRANVCFLQETKLEMVSVDLVRKI
ncbi:hypothetical protein Gotur_031390 [Gossypium turneri]